MIYDKKVVSRQLPALYWALAVFPGIPVLIVMDLFSRILTELPGAQVAAAPAKFRETFDKSIQTSKRTSLKNFS